MKKMKPVLYVFILNFLLCSCGTQRQQVAQQEFASLKAYCNQLMNNAEIDPIRGKIAIYSDDQATFGMISDQSIVLPTQKSAVHIFGENKMSCQRESVVSYNKLGMQRQSAIAQYYYSITNGLVAQLYNGQISFGEYNKQRQKVVADMRIAMQQANDQAVAQAQQAYQTYLMHAQTLNQLHQVNNNIQNQNKSVTCTTFGNSTTCN
jgi:hypothetical protein